MQNHFSSYRWRRYVPFLVFATVVAIVQLYAIAIKDPHFIKNAIQTLSNTKNRGNETLGPLHVLLVSYARTGSSFVGDLLQSVPDTFYHFEPLHFISNPVLNSSFDDARVLLNKVFNCNVSSIKGYLPWIQLHKEYMKLKRSLNYWKECSKKKKNLCFNASFVDSTCRKHKTVIVKTIRLKLREASELFLTHPNLNLKIIYLMRDPRGSINSRMKFPVSMWCKKDPMCSNPKYYCDSLAEDMKVACGLLKDRPEDFLIIRYEDLALDPFGTTDRLVKFLGMPSMPRDVEIFLKTHTSVIGSVREKYRTQGVDYAYSTFRNSSITAMSWRQQMSFKRVTQLQNYCQTTLTGMGYYPYYTVSNLRSNVNFDKNNDDAIRSYCSAN
ncbi:hypothetical protein JTE90_022133 [Oedothorax gibbosus]|uniref:Sulfotransferase domain-containing protein n=1 Tax=Oedothorax gibbosus TaxID=931172 RepID=A0AAV6VV48_9ARAC|nr:hypothetical protein JTE90_022133 [Oedothorax gibbosus]